MEEDAVEEEWDRAAVAGRAEAAAEADAWEGRLRRVRRASAFVRNVARKNRTNAARLASGESARSAAPR